MGRPRTLGPPITFRLPLDLHAVLAERAEANGVTPDDYVKSRFAAALEAHIARETTTATTTGVEPRWKASMKGKAS